MKFSGYLQVCIVECCLTFDRLLHGIPMIPRRLLGLQRHYQHRTKVGQSNALSLLCGLAPLP